LRAPASAAPRAAALELIRCHGATHTSAEIAEMGSVASADRMARQG
jgi:hypothetical protein